jgi:hypothetical protein
MSNVRDEGEVPPQQFNEDGNPIVIEDGSKSETSKPPTLEYLMKKLEKLKVENKKLIAKGRKLQHTPPQAKTATLMRKSSRRGGKEGTSTIRLPITLCLLITITCLARPLILPYPLEKLPVWMGQTITNGNIA